MPSDNVPGTPKVQVEVNTPYGARLQSVDVDSNQIQPVTEFEYFWLKRLYPPARLPDVVLRAGLIVCASAFGMSITLVLLVLMAVARYAVRNDRNLELLLAGHLALIALGLLIGGLI